VDAAAGAEAVVPLTQSWTSAASARRRPLRLSRPTSRNCAHSHPPRHRARGRHLRLARPGRLLVGDRRYGPAGQQLCPWRGLRPARSPARVGRRREALSARAPRGRKGIRPPCPGGYTGPARVNRITNRPGSRAVTDAVSPSGSPMAPASDTRPVSSLPGQGTSCGVPSCPTASATRANSSRRRASQI